MSHWWRVALVSMTLALVGSAGVVVSPASAASTPAKPAVTSASGNGWVAVKWSAAPANGKSILSYQVGSRRYSSWSGKWTPYSYVTLKPSVRSRTVAVTNGVKLQLRVRARNALGYGGWNAVTTVAGLPAAVPGTKGSAGDRTATASWATPANNGSAITSYRLYFRKYSSGAWSSWSYKTSAASARTLAITGLTNGVTTSSSQSREPSRCGSAGCCGEGCPQRTQAGAPGDHPADHGDIHLARGSADSC